MAKMNCTNVFSDPQNEKCRSFLPSNATSGEKSEGCIWACSDLEIYCPLVLQVIRIYLSPTPPWTDNFLSIAKPYFLFPIGLLGNFLFFLTLTSRSLTGSIFVFLRSIAAVQFLQVFVKIFEFAFPGEEPMRKNGFKALVNGFRQIVPSLAFFLAFERFVAVCRPNKFSKLKNSKYVPATMIFSFLLGAVHFEVIFESWVSGKGTTADGSYFYDKYLEPIMLSVKIVQTVAMILMGLSVIRILRRRSTQVTDLMSGDRAHAEYVEMRTLCIFQGIDLVITVIDVSASATTEIFSIIELIFNEKHENSSGKCSYEDTLPIILWSIRKHYVQFGSDIFQSFGNGEIFVIYLIFLKKFRRAFVDIFEMVKKLRGICRRREDDQMYQGT